MATTVKYYHSGGIANIDPLLDLGGPQSVFTLSNSLDNLFDTLDSSESVSGLTDYRCFYIQNTGADTLYNTSVYIIDEKPSGSSIDVGATLQNAIQVITFTGTPNEGETVIFAANTTKNFTVPYSPNPTFFAKDFQTQIRSINLLNDVIVTVTGAAPLITMTVYYVGQAANKDFPLISVVTNNLTGTTIGIIQTQQGSPVNRTAVTISGVSYAPAGVTFNYQGPGNPILLGDLETNDYAAIWARRFTPSQTRKLTKDYCTIVVSGGGF